MTIARAEKDKAGQWWVVSHAFPSTVHGCKTHGDADRLKDALNLAYEMGREAKRQEIAALKGALDDALAEPLPDGFEEYEQS
jgi:hypothetical protein